MNEKLPPRKQNSFVQRLGFALNGVVVAWKREPNFRIQSFLVTGLFCFCIWDRTPALWCAIFAGLSALVLSLEMVNSALETILDRFHPEHDAATGVAKDCLAGAVLVSSVASLIVFSCYLFAR